MKIYTKKGDFGKSQIIGKKNINKNELIFEVIGTLDELNSIIGISNFYIKSKNLLKIQNTLFLIGTYMALNNKKLFNNKHITKIKNHTIKLEKDIDAINDKLPPLKNFIIPGGSKKSAYTHLARSITRRCERKIVKLSKKQKINNVVLVFINRLSDYFFVLARYYNKVGKNDVIWKI